MVLSIADWWQQMTNQMPVLAVPWIQSVIVLLAFFVVSQLFAWTFERVVLYLTRKTRTEIDDKIAHSLRGPIAWFLVTIGLKIAVVPLGLTSDFSAILQNVFSSMLVLITAKAIIAVLIILIDTWGRKFAERTKSHLDDQLVDLFRKFTYVVGWIVAILFGLQVWGIQIGPLLATLGVGGIAIAFALQSSLGNIFGGISLILDKTVKVGDRIELDDGTIGTVFDVGLRSTRIRTFNNEIVVIPNGKLADMKIQNYLYTKKAADNKVRVTVDFGVEYGSKVEKVQEVVLHEIGTIAVALKDPKPKVDFVSMGDFALIMKARFWVEDVSKRYDAQIEATKKIYAALNRSKIGIPFPTRTVYMKKS